MGDILRNKERNTEKKFLNDYSYTIFEKELLSKDRVINISHTDTSIEKISNDKSFIKVTSSITFNDINSIISTFKNYNDIGKAITHISNFENISKSKIQLNKALQTTKDKNAKSKLNAEFKSLTNINNLAKESGLHQDPEFIENLMTVLSYGFQDQLEVQMSVLDAIFSANLNRSYLRETEDLVIRKYARQTEVRFTLFGIITQRQSNNDEIDNDETVEKEGDGGFKEAIMNIVTALSTVEASFTGRLTNEIIIDPIALYNEI